MEDNEEKESFWMIALSWITGIGCFGGSCLFQIITGAITIAFGILLVLFILFIIRGCH